MTEGARRAPHLAGLGPVLGAVGVAGGALVLSVAILVWRGGAQRQVLDAETARCRKADLAACDQLRSQCIKRSGESCTPPAESIPAPPAPPDTREAVRPPGEACELRARPACLRPSKPLGTGDGPPADLRRAA